MKKLLVVLLFALAFVLCFVSCGDKDSSGTPEQGTPEQKPPHVCAPAAAVIENKVEHFRCGAVAKASLKWAFSHLA